MSTKKVPSKKSTVSKTSTKEIAKKPISSEKGLNSKEKNSNSSKKESNKIEVKNTKSNSKSDDLKNKKPAAIKTVSAKETKSEKVAEKVIATKSSNEDFETRSAKRESDAEKILSKLHEAELQADERTSLEAARSANLDQYPQTINQRLNQIRFMIQDIKVDAMAVSYVPNIRYLTNFSGSSAYMLITPDELHFVTDDRYEEQISSELYKLKDMKIHITRDVWNYIVDNDLLPGVKELGFEADRMGYSEAVDIRNVIRPMKFKPASNEIEPFTIVKAPEEIAYIRQSAAIAERTYNKVLEIVRSGMTENDLANEIIYISRKFGSEGEAFPTIVASGPRTSMPHAMPSERRIKKNEMILIDFGCRFNGFCSDITRCFVLGKPSKEQKNIYEIVKNAQKEAIKNARPNINVKILDSFARNIIEKAGYGDNFQHSLGHGIGISAHERPHITFRIDDQVVPENSTITIEPGIYFPGKYGIRIEDMIVVSKGGPEMLTNSPDELPGI